MCLSDITQESIEDRLIIMATFSFAKMFHAL